MFVAWFPFNVPVILKFKYAGHLHEKRNFDLCDTLEAWPPTDSKYKLLYSLQSVVEYVSFWSQNIFKNTSNIIPSFFAFITLNMTFNYAMRAFHLAARFLDPNFMKTLRPVGKESDKMRIEKELITDEEAVTSTRVINTPGTFFARVEKVLGRMILDGLGRIYFWWTRKKLLFRDGWKERNWFGLME